MTVGLLLQQASIGGREQEGSGRVFPDPFSGVSHLDSIWLTDSRTLEPSCLCSETLLEMIESCPLCITDLFQNKSAAYF